MVQDAVERWIQVDRLLDRVLALPLTDRAAFVQQQTTDDPRLRGEVLSLLAALETRDDLLDRPAVEALKRRAPAPDLPPGHRIGAYRLLSLLGRGGMGEVYLAERADGQFEQRVALKLLRQDAVEHLGLFVSERRILAQLEHPGIARLYDAGVDADGRPYMVMELVEGIPITDWSRQHNSALAQRLDLFTQVCEAVAYAHQHLVIHRDLKPANILVTDDGRIKLLDFGVAKLLSGAVEEATRNTPLTLSYAAPEQLTRTTVSTATDIYALGVLLFELLTGKLPWATGQTPVAVAVDKILHEPAPAPSVITAGTASLAVPARSLSGDLDAIVGKALRKTAADRYATVIGLQADVLRHVRGEPVAARQGARAYVLGRLIHRYRWAVTAVTALIVALAAGLAGTLWQAHRAETQARIAQTQAQNAVAVQKFMGDVFRANSSNQDDPVKARQTTARELLDIGAGNIGRTMSNAPAARIGVLNLLAELYDDLALDDQAVAMRKQAVAVTRKLNGEDSTETAAALINLAGSMHASTAVNQRGQTLDEATAILDRIHDTSSMTRAALFGKLSEHYESLDTARALDYADQQLKLLEANPPSTHLAEALFARGLSQSNESDARAAAASFRRGIKVSRAVDGFPNPSLPRLYAYLGLSLSQLQDISGAERSARLAYRTAKAINGERHVDTLQTGMRLGRLLYDTGRPGEGLALLEASNRLALDIRGADDPFHTPQTRIELGFTLARYGLLERGLAQMQLAIANRRANRPGTLFLATMLEDAAYALIEMGRYDEARINLDEATAIRLKSGTEPATDPLRFNTESRIRLALVQGHIDDARSLLKTYYVDPGESRGAAPAAIMHGILAADIALAAGDTGSAIGQARAVRDRIAKAGLTTYMTSQAMRLDGIEGEALLQSGTPGKAEPVLERTLQMRKTLLDPVSARIAEVQVELARCALARGAIADALRLQKNAAAIQAAHRQLGKQYRDPLRRLQSRLKATNAQSRR
ncbi:MAG: serine/threonine-protein kinase [Pseudoxanthomonas sp.]